MEHLKKQNLQHAIMPVEVFALRKRRTSSQNMCYRLLRFTAESALHVTLPSSSCLFTLVLLLLLLLLKHAFLAVGKVLIILLSRNF